MYSADLTVWLWTILFHGENNRPYNVGSNRSITISDLAHLIAKHDNSNNIKVITKSPISNNPQLRYVPNIDKAIKNLNLQIFQLVKKNYFL